MVGVVEVCPAAVKITDPAVYPVALAYRMWEPVVSGSATIAFTEPVESVVTVRVTKPAPLSDTVRFPTPVPTVLRAVTSTVCWLFTADPTAVSVSVPPVDVAGGVDPGVEPPVTVILSVADVNPVAAARSVPVATVRLVGVSTRTV